jgi:hypothetical protein
MRIKDGLGLDVKSGIYKSKECAFLNKMTNEKINNNSNIGILYVKKNK